jgi:hypothetical protein
MRRAVVLLGLIALAGCGGDSETTTVTVTTTVAAEESTPPRLPFPLPADGTLAVDEFNAYTDEIDEPWERDLASVAGAFVEAGATDAARRTFESTSRDEGATATATLILAGLFDDSVDAQRFDFELERRNDGSWELTAASWSQRCREGRGHQGFAPEPCV